jgi:hypothetical protein
MRQWPPAPAPTRDPARGAGMLVMHSQWRCAIMLTPRHVPTDTSSGVEDGVMLALD